MTSCAPSTEMTRSLRTRKMPCPHPTAGTGRPGVSSRKIRYRPGREARDACDPGVERATSRKGERPDFAGITTAAQDFSNADVIVRPRHSCRAEAGRGIDHVSDDHRRRTVADVLE